MHIKGNEHWNNLLLKQIRENFKTITFTSIFRKIENYIRIYVNGSVYIVYGENIKNTKYFPYFHSVDTNLISILTFYKWCDIFLLVLRWISYWIQYILRLFQILSTWNVSYISSSNILCLKEENDTHMHKNTCTCEYICLQSEVLLW